MVNDETLVVNGLVADGSGEALRAADLLIAGDGIRAVEPPGTVSHGGRMLIDATELVIAPGFVDCHSHADNAPLLDNDDTSKILQGVTTEVVGNCGFSLAPCPAEQRADISRLTERLFPPMDWSWASWPDLDAELEQHGFVTNYAPLVGHGTLRAAAFGVADRPPSKDELRLMKRELQAALDAGTFGMSSGLIYPPGVYSDIDELVALAAVLGEDRVYATHMRGEGDRLLASIDEAVTIGARAGCRTHLSHLKWTGRHNWGRISEAFERIDAAAGSGVPISADVYPYTASATFLSACLPPRMLAGDENAILDRLRDPGCRDGLLADLESANDWDNVATGAGWDNILVSTTASHANEGRTLREIADDQDVHPVDVLIRILVEERLQASMVVFDMSEDDVMDVLAYDRSMVGSDGLPPGRGGRPHPRMYGTFPRFIGHYARDRRLLPLGEAVRRVTAVPAETFRIPGRGRIRRGYVADLVAFDPATIRDDCDFLDPVRVPSGIAWVMQGGHTVVEGQRYLGPRRGRRLTPA